MMGTMKKMLVFLCGVVWIAGSGSLVAAADVAAQNLTLTPVKQEMPLRAGDTYTGSFRLLNAGQSPYDLKVYAKPYWIKDEHYTADFEAKRPNTDFYEWVHFSKTQYHLAPNQMVTVDYAVHVPQNAGPGGHYGVLFAETLPTNNKNNFGVSSTQRLGMLAFGKVDGNHEVSGNIKSQTISFFQFTRPLKTMTRFENTGNIDFNGELNLTVKNVFGATKYTTARDSSVLPGTVRRVELNWEQSPPFGLYRVELVTRFLDTITRKNAYVLMAPIWFYMVVPLLLLGGIVYVVQRRR